MLRLDIHLSESDTQMRHGKEGKEAGDTLLYCLLQVLLGGIELILEELDFAGEGIIGGLAVFCFF